MSTRPGTVTGVAAECDKVKSMRIPAPAAIVNRVLATRRRPYGTVRSAGNHGADEL
jgi:hypothetical protein